MEAAVHVLLFIVGAVVGFFAFYGFVLYDYGRWQDNVRNRL